MMQALDTALVSTSPTRRVGGVRDDDGHGGERDSKVRTRSSTREAKHPPVDAPMIRDKGAGRDVAVARRAAVPVIARSSARPGAVRASSPAVLRWLRDNARASCVSSEMKSS